MTSFQLHTVKDNNLCTDLFLVWSDGTKLEYPDRIQTNHHTEFVWIHQSFSCCSVELLTIFFIDWDSIHNKLPSDYSLNICFSRRFLYADSPEIVQSCSEYRMFIFETSVTLRFFHKLYPPVFTRTPEKKFEDVFLQNSKYVHELP